MTSTTHDQPERALRVAVLATHPIQYQAPLWRSLALRPELKLHVFFGSDISVRGYRDEGFGVKVQWDVPLLAGYEHTFLSQDLALRRISFWEPRAKNLRKHLHVFSPDVVLLTAYNSVFWIRAVLQARLLGLPIVLRHEASDAASSRSSCKAFVRDLALRGFYSQIARFAAIGTEARQHLGRLGIPADRIGWAPYCVDSVQVEAQVGQWLPRRDELRAKLGIGAGDVALIFSGKLIPKKQPLLILDAIEGLSPSRRQRIHLIVMGDGELRADVERKGRQVLGARFHQAGFVNQSEMGQWYAVADCLVLPSKKGAGETWGLVVNEALQFGLPAVVSDGVGCHPDLVGPATGRVFRSGSADDLARALSETMSSLLGNRAATAAACRERVGLFSLGMAERGLTESLHHFAAQQGSASRS
jgi:glycosyltransferase involved in cell wall biosynthesis